MEAKRTTISFYGDGTDRAVDAEGLALKVQKTFKGELSAALITTPPVLTNVGVNRILTASYFEGEENFEKTDYSFNYGKNADGTSMEAKRTTISFYGDGTDRAVDAEGLALKVQKTFKGELSAALITTPPVLTNVGVNRILTASYFEGEENFEKTDYSFNYGKNADGTSMEAKRTTISFYGDGTDRAVDAEGLALKVQKTFKGELSAALITTPPVLTNVGVNRILTASHFEGEENFEKTDYSFNYGKNADGTSMEAKRTTISFYGDGTDRAVDAEGLALKVQKTFKGELSAALITTPPVLTNVAVNRILTASYFEGEENFEKTDYSFNYGKNADGTSMEAKRTTI